MTVPHIDSGLEFTREVGGLLVAAGAAFNLTVYLQSGSKQFSTLPLPLHRRKVSALLNPSDELLDPVHIKAGINDGSDSLIAEMHVNRAGVGEGVCVIQNQAMPRTRRP